jgi:hypothetical protein
MILHAASIAAFFAAQTQQAQCAVQCVQATPDSWLKWLLPTIVQTVISLASITAGVWIAVASFRANKIAEHKQWVRDQKKAEWRELLDRVSPVCIRLTLDRPKGTMLNDKVTKELAYLVQCLDDRIFIERNIVGEISEQVTACIDTISRYTSVQVSCIESTPEDQGKEILKSIRDITESVRNAAKKDLDTEGVDYPEIKPH